LESVHRQV